MTRSLKRFDEDLQCLGWTAALFTKHENGLFNATILRHLPQLGKKGKLDPEYPQAQTKD